MDNHVHILAKADTRSLSAGFHRLATAYALYFNSRHGHAGPVFQDRFDSLPVETEEHLLAATRYIHLNPFDLGAEFPGDYLWSFDAYGPRFSSAEAEQAAIACLGVDFADKLALLDKEERNRAIRRLRAQGLSVRQIERMTGIGRNIIARA